MKQTFLIKGKYGLHSRPAFRFVELAKKYQSSIRILYNDKDIDAKSLVSVLSAGISSGSTIELLITGDDEVDAMNTLSDFFNNPIE